MKTFLFTLFITVPVLLLGQGIEISVLDNRFSFVFPGVTEIVPNRSNAAPEDPTVNHITMIAHTNGNNTLFFFAEELFEKSPADLEKRLQEDSTLGKHETKTLSTRDSLLTVLQTYNFTRPLQNLILISQLTVKNPDNTLSLVSSYINIEAVLERKKFQQIAENVFSSIKKGKKQLNLNERTELYTILGTKSKIQIKIPNDYFLSVNKQSDFEVYTIKQVFEYGKREISAMTIYFGYEPKSIGFFYGLEKNQAPSTIEELMFRKAVWDNYSYTEDGRNKYLREQVFIDDDIKKDMGLHIAIYTDTKAAADSMSGIVKNILLIYDK